MYNAIIVPIVTYGAFEWFNKSGHSLVKRHLLAAQRTVLLVLIKACRTTTTVAMQIISGSRLFKLEVVSRGIIGRIRRRPACVMERLHVYGT